MTDESLADYEREMNVEALVAIGRVIEAQMDFDDAKAELAEAREAFDALRAFGVIKA